MLNTVGTDHCPFTMEQKRMGQGDFTKIPNGAAGVEERLAVMYTLRRGGRPDHAASRWSSCCATAPARIFGLYPRKGDDRRRRRRRPRGVRPDRRAHDLGEDAPLEVRPQHLRGIRGHRRPSYVVAAGRVQYANGDLKVERGAGRFLRREPRAAASTAAALVGAGNAGRRAMNAKTDDDEEPRPRSAQAHKKFLFPACTNYYAEPIVLDRGQGHAGEGRRREASTSTSSAGSSPCRSGTATTR